MAFGAFLGLFILIAVIFFGRLLGGMSAERRYVRKHGVSQSTPICAKCEYTAVGWTSPICPECGADASVTGLRVGFRRKTVWKDAILMAAFVGVIMPLVLVGANWIGKADIRSGSMDFAFENAPSLQMTYTYSVTDVRVLPLDSEEAWVQFFSNDTGAASPKFSTSDLDDHALGDAISDLTDLDADARGSLVADVRGMVSTSTMTHDTSTWRIPPSMEVRGGGYTVRPHAWRFAVMIGMIVTVLPLGILVINRILKRERDGYEFPATDSERWKAASS